MRGTWRLFSQISKSQTRQQTRASVGFASVPLAVALMGVQQRCSDSDPSVGAPERSTYLDAWNVILSRRNSYVRCDDFRDDADHLYPSGYSESDRFFQCLEFHRSMISDYRRRWVDSSDDYDTQNTIAWPRNIPSSSEISSLEVDLQFSRKSPLFRNDQRKCQDKEFLVATYYVNQDDDASQIKGMKMIKDLASKGHPDSMCMYGIILNEGKVPGVESHPDLAVVWWRRCVDFHNHISATYELALALYTGEGVAENTELAFTYFAHAAHLGHAGAAYMLGECLLDGVGVPRDRASSLEWLVTAAELGHHLARKRVIYILQQDYDELNEGRVEKEAPVAESKKWADASMEDVVRDVNIERRFTIGGGSSNPKILARRKTKVEESRDPDESV